MPIELAAAAPELAAAAPEVAASLPSLALPLGLGIVLAATAGLRAFFPLFLVSALGYTGAVELSDSLSWMASPATVLCMATAVFLEVSADKLPFVDHFVDTAGTLVRPAAGALVGTSLLAGASPLVAMVFGLGAGGAVAGMTHLGKASARAGSTATTGGLANPVVSIIEDVAALGVGGAAALVAAGAL
jgi:hypothetical protein